MDRPRDHAAVAQRADDTVHNAPPKCRERSAAGVAGPPSAAPSWKATQGGAPERREGKRNPDTTACRPIEPFAPAGQLHADFMAK
jgi:hypothetical protein